MASHRTDHDHDHDREREGERDRDRDRDREPVPLSQRLLLRPEEAAAMLGLGRTMIYELLRAGEALLVEVGAGTLTDPMRRSVYRFNWAGRT